MELVLPSAAYKASFIEAVREFQAADSTDLRSQEFKKLSVAELESDFEQYIESLRLMERGVNLPENYVSASTYWLIDNSAFVGSVNIRHRLTEHLLAIGGHIGYDIRPGMRHRGYGTEILRLALPKAKALGIDRALVTCDVSNEGSRKIIEKNGGILENEVMNPETGEGKLRFWISL